MPRLVKGGKHTFGWSRVADTGGIRIPPEAVKEYRMKDSEKLIVLPGSQTSGGFGLGSEESVGKSALRIVLGEYPELGQFRLPDGEAIEYKGKQYCWITLGNGAVTVPPETLQKYGVNIGDKLLVIRGSGLAIGFAVRGPIVEEAKKHRELQVFAPET